MQILLPVRAPTLLSRRMLFEQKLSDLHKCTDLNELKQLHALIYKSNLHKDLSVAPKIITALSLCRQMGLALKVFDQIPSPNSHLCNTLIKAYIRNSEPEKALEVFSRMQASGIFPDNNTYRFLLKAHSELKFVKIIHAYVEKFNLYSDLFMPNSLIDAYSKYGSMGVEAAKALFDVMEERDLVTYNSMINGLVKVGQLKEVKQLFDVMEESDLVTYNSMISGLVKVGQLKEAKQLFDVMKERDLVTYNSMISGLVKVGQLKEAKQLFDEMPRRNRVSWNAILDGYVKAGEMSTAFKVFEKMQSRDVVPWSTVIYGYARIGDIDMAKVLFDMMPEKNLVAWTIMISGYAEKGLAKEAITLYDQMEREKMKLGDATFVSILSACNQYGMLNLGNKIHSTITKSRYNCSLVISNALIDMYCKCGNLNRAGRCFNEMETKDLVSWNTMIHGLAMQGHGKKALHLFESMKLQGFAPNNVTLLGVLSACNHAGLIEDGIRYFYTMESGYSITPQIEHYGCMIDLLGRGGRLNEALRLLNCMPFEPNIVIWCSLLGACRRHNALLLAEEVLGQLVKLDPTNAGKYSMLSNVYAAAEDWENAANVEDSKQNASGC